MKRGVLFIISLLLAGPVRANPGALVERVIDALIAVESGGRADAIGDGGRAVGCLQIWPVCVAEANRLIGRTRWTLEDRTCPRESRAMARTILIWHYRRGVTDPVELATKWRNPFSVAPQWYRNRVAAALNPEP